MANESAQLQQKVSRIEQATQRNGNILEVQKLLNLESASNEKLRDRVSALEDSLKEQIE